MAISCCLNVFSQIWETQNSTYIHSKDWYIDDVVHLPNPKMVKFPNSNDILFAQGGTVRKFGDNSWVNEYGPSHIPPDHGQTHFIETLPDGFLISWEYYLRSWPELIPERSHFITKIDFDGNLIYQKENVTNGYNQSSGDIVLDAYAFGDEKVITIEYQNGNKIRCYDIEGNFLWSIISPFGFWDTKPSVFKGENGNLLIGTKIRQLAKVNPETGDIISITGNTGPLSEGIIMDKNFEGFYYLYHNKILKVNNDGLIIKSIPFPQMEIAKKQPWVVMDDGTVCILGYEDKNFLLKQIDLESDSIILESSYPIFHRGVRGESWWISKNEYNEVFICGFIRWGLLGDRYYLDCKQIVLPSGRMKNEWSGSIHSQDYDDERDITGLLPIDNTCFLSYEFVTGIFGDGMPSWDCSYLVRLNEKEEKIGGYVFADTLKNCQKDDLEFPIENVVFEVYGSNGFKEVATTNSIGEFEIEFPNRILRDGSLNYTILFKGQEVSECQQDLSNLIQTTPSGVIEFPIQAEFCSDLVISNPIIETGNWVLCTNDMVKFMVGNRGFLPAEDSYLILEKDDRLKLIHSNIPHSSISEDSVRIELGDIGITDTKEIELMFKVDCTANINQELCIAVSVFPNQQCDGASLNEYFINFCSEIVYPNQDAIQLEIANQRLSNRFYRNTKDSLFIVFHNNTLDTITNWNIELTSPKFDLLKLASTFTGQNASFLIDTMQEKLIFSKQNLLLLPLETDTVTLNINFPKFFFDWPTSLEITYSGTFVGENLNFATIAPFQDVFDIGEWNWSYSPKIRFYQNGAIAAPINILEPLELEINFTNERDFIIEKLNYELNLSGDINNFSVDSIVAPNNPNFEMIGNIIKINFDGIEIPIDSVFTIKVNLDLSQNSFIGTKQMVVNSYFSVSDMCNFFQNTPGTKVFQIQGLSSLHEIGINNFSISPNPSNSQINFTFDSPVSKPLQFTLYNIAGQKVFFREVSGDFIIEKSEVGSGVFFFEMRESGVVIERGKVIFIN